MPFLRIGVGGQSWDVDLAKLLNVEIIAIERAVGMSVVELGEALDRGSVLALTAVVWVMRRRGDPGLKFDDVTFPIGELDSTWVQDEDDPVAQGKDEASEVATAST